MTDAVLRVRLTGDQQARVKALTGREMEVLELDDPYGVEAGRMPGLRPPQIEFMAIQEARRLNAEDEAERRWVVDLARAQDEEAARAREMAELARDSEREARREQKRMEAEFKLIAAGKKTPRQVQEEAEARARRKAGRKGGGA